MQLTYRATSRHGGNGCIQCSNIGVPLLVLLDVRRPGGEASAASFPVACKSRVPVSQAVSRGDTCQSIRVCAYAEERYFKMKPSADYSKHAKPLRVHRDMHIQWNPSIADTLGTW